MESLADFLGTTLPKEERRTRKLEKLTGRKFAEAVLRSQEFYDYVVRGLIAGDIAPAVLSKLMDHGWGKVIETVKMEVSNNLEELTVEQLESRALLLAERARQLRMSDDRVTDDERIKGSVH